MEHSIALVAGTIREVRYAAASLLAAKGYRSSSPGADRLA
jgi:hypothetical protein